MAPVNPDLRIQNTPEFVNDSRGASGFKSENTLGSLFEGIGELVTGATRATDNYFKKAIETEATERVDAIRDSVLGYRTPPKGAVESNAPDEVVRQGERLKNLTQAYQSGRVTESHYWMLLDVEARKLRTKYPGYRDYIDNTISGLVGTNPANALVRSLRQEAAASSRGSKDDSVNHLRALEERVTLGGLMSQEEINAFKEKNPTADAGAVRNYILSVAGKTASTKAAIEAERASLNLESARGEVVDRRADKIADQEIAFVRAKNDRIMFNGMNLTPTELYDTIRKTPGFSLTPEQDAELAKNGTLWIKKNLAEAAAALDRTDEKGFSISVAIGSQKRKEKLAALEEELTLMFKDIRDKNYTLAAAGPILQKAKENEDWRIVYGTDDITRGTAVVRQAYGENAVNIYLQGKEVDFRQSINKGVSNLSNRPTSPVERASEISSKILAMSQGTPMQELIEKQKKAGVDNRESHTSLLNDTLSAITNPKLPVELKAKLVQSLYGPKNEGFLSRLTDSKGNLSKQVQLNYFNRMVSPEVERALYDIASTTGDKRLWEYYSVWAMNTASALARVDLNTLQNAVEYRKRINVTFDNKTLQFRVEPRPDSDKNFNASNTQMAKLLESIQEIEVDRAIGRVNNMLNRISPIIKRSEDVEQEQVKLLKFLGIDLNATFNPNGTALDQLSLALQKALRPVLQRMGGTRPLAVDIMPE